MTLCSDHREYPSERQACWLQLTFFSRNHADTLLEIWQNCIQVLVNAFFEDFADNV